MPAEMLRVSPRKRSHVGSSRRRRYAVRVIPDHPDLCPPPSFSPQSSLFLREVGRRDRVREDGGEKGGTESPTFPRLI